MLRTAWSQIRRHPSRIVAVCLAIILGVGFASAALVFSATFSSHLAHTVSAQSAQADVVVTEGDAGGNPAAEIGTIDKVPGVQVAQALPSADFEYTSANSHGSLGIDALPEDPRLQWFGLSEGRWPAATNEILVDSSTAASANIPLGSTVTLIGWEDGKDITATVVGIADTSSSALAGAHEQAYAVPALMSALAGPLAARVSVLGAPGVSPDDLAGRIAAVVPELTVRTGFEQAHQDINQLGGNTEVLSTILLGFAFVALVVATIVIANTFTILLTQRRQQIALLRCVGAAADQVRRSVLVEAALVGAIGSIAGVATGIGVGLLTARITGLDSAGPSFNAPLQLAVLGIGVAITILAAWVPASRAMRIPPLAALRPVPAPETEQRAGRTRALLGGGLLITGLGVLTVGVWQTSLLIAMAGGALSAFGILFLARIFVPPVLRLVGRAGRIAGVPGRLAAANSVRNPGRAASTSAALMVGVGLIVTLQVAAASASATFDRSVADRYPLDVAVTAVRGTVPSAVVGQIGATPGLSGVTAIPGTIATAPGVSAHGPGAAPGDPGFSLLGVTEAGLAVTRGGTTALADDTVLVPSWWIGAGIDEGQQLTISVGPRHRTFTVAAGHLGEAGVNGGSVVTTAAALKDLDPRAGIVAVWAAAVPDADLVAMTSSLNELVAPHRDLQLTGAASERAATGKALGTIITLATGMLAVAVVIAIVGIGNTLGLSVIERTRESALLRALGLRRRQLRSMLATEAVLLAVVGAIVGIAAGVFYGWAGARSAIGAADRTMVFEIPWIRLVLVLGIAVAAALLASVLPARRAATASPVDALAEA